MKDWRNELVDCECGEQVKKGHLQKHKDTALHKKRTEEKQMHKKKVKWIKFMLHELTFQDNPKPSIKHFENIGFIQCMNDSTTYFHPDLSSTDHRDHCKPCKHHYGDKDLSF